MAVTLAQSALLSQSMLQRGVIETIIEVSPILDYLPFSTVEGTSFLYNQESTLPNADFYSSNALWVEGTGTVVQQTANLTILGGDADVDNFIQRTRSNVNDQKAIAVAMKAKAMSRKFEQTFINGNDTTDPNSFDGLAQLVTAGAAGGNGGVTTGGQTIELGTSGAALTLSFVDQLIDLVKSGLPDILLMSKRTRRRLKALLVASAHYIEEGTNEFGRQVMTYDGIPCLVSDFILDTELGSVGGSTLSSMYAIQFSEADGLCGLQNGGIEVVDIGQLETKDASRVRLRWYVGLALLRASAAARLSSINNS